MRQKLLCCLWVINTLIGSTGCRVVKEDPALDLTKRACQIAAQHGFEKKEIKTKAFLLSSFQKLHKPGAPITIYIEGDGATWITLTQLSQNPTPRNPLALKLAVLDKSANVVYLARPCQYTPLVLEPHCKPEVWSDLRFSKPIIDTMNTAIEKIKKEVKSDKIHLVGFSGGAAIAVLIAAMRHDIASLRTVAGDLNHVALSHYHQTTPLLSALNPFLVADKLTTLPQQHCVGNKDKIIPVFISQEFVNEVNKRGTHCASSTVLEGVTHHQGWEKRWPSLLQQPFPCS